jgi:hypothetical protein
MHLKIKAICLAGLAVVAVSASMASAASAAPKFTSSQAKSLPRGEQFTKLVFSTAGGLWECTSFVFEGSLTGAAGGGLGFESPLLTLHPTTTGCITFGLSSTFETTGCNFVFAAAGTASIECETGKQMVLKIPGAACSMTFGAQGPLSGVSFKSEGSGASEGVLMTLNVSKISYTSTGGFCGASGANLNLKGSVTVRDFTESKLKTQTGLAWDAS